MKYATSNDIRLAIDILRLALDKTDGTYVHGKIKPAIHRVIFELEDLK